MFSTNFVRPKNFELYNFTWNILGSFYTEVRTYVWDFFRKFLNRTSRLVAEALEVSLSAVLMDRSDNCLIPNFENFYREPADTDELIFGTFWVRTFLAFVVESSEKELLANSSINSAKIRK